MVTGRRRLVPAEAVEVAIPSHRRLVVQGTGPWTQAVRPDSSLPRRRRSRSVAPLCLERRVRRPRRLAAGTPTLRLRARYPRRSCPLFPSCPELRHLRCRTLRRARHSDLPHR